jgi:2-keto-4-pentenoate hydratase
MYTISRTRRVLHHAASISLIVLSAAPALSHAACPGDEAVSAYIEDMKAVRQNATFSAGLSLQDAQCARAKLIAALPAVLGPQVGYRATFTSELPRAMVRLEAPVWGAMFGKELHHSPAKVPAAYGSIPYWDTDLIVEVKDAKLADAKTPLQALASLSAVIPYIGLKDNRTNETESMEHFVAINAGFRAGVVGERIPVTPNARFLKALANMEVRVIEDGTLINKVRGKVQMDGNPVHAVMWLARELRKNGIELKRGDLLAVGGFTLAQRPRPNSEISVQYLGLPGNPSISVRFD